MTETVNYYNPNDGIHGRTGGPYLDQQQQIELERLNAFREGRDPDYDNLPLTPGITPVTARKLVEGYNSTSLDGNNLLESVEITAPVLASAEVVVPEEDDSDSTITNEDEKIVNPSDGKELGNTSLFD